MKRWGLWIVLTAAILLVACAAPRVLTEVELQEKALTDLNATMHALNKELDAVRSQQLLLPKGSPRYLSVGREVALLNEKSSNFALEWEGRQMDLEEARRKEAEAAIAATNATSTAQPVQTVGDFKLYPFTLTTDTDQGTKAVTGEVENTNHYIQESIKSFYTAQGEAPDDGWVSIPEGSEYPDLNDADWNALDSAKYNEWAETNDPENSEN